MQNTTPASLLTNMNTGTAQTTQEAVNALLTLRRFAPYRFSGKWYVAVIDGQGVAYRSIADLRKRAAKAGLASFEMASI